MSIYIHKSHNVTVLLYHLVFPAKYRKVVFDGEVDAVLKTVCLEIEKRYEVKFLEIGTDQDHVHFFGAISTDVLSEKTSANDQEYNS